MKGVKMRIIFLLVLAMSCTVMALERLPEPEVSFSNLIMAGLLLLFLSPIGWGILILIVIGVITAFFKGAKKVVTTDYTPIPAMEKRDALLRALEEEGR